MDKVDPFATRVCPQRQLLSVVLDRVWPQLDWHVASNAVLDVGCGSGDVTAYELLLPRLPGEVRVVVVAAADQSDSAVAHAAAKFVGLRLCFLQFHIGTRRIQNTSVWRLGPYSKVFSFLSLQWEQRLRRAIKNISKLLCPGGESVLVLISRSDLFASYMNRAKSAKWSSYLKDYQQFLSPYQFSGNPEDDMNSYLQEAGFTVKRCYEQETMYVTEGEQSLRETMAAINPFLGRLPKDLRGTFQRECEEDAFKNGAVTARKLCKGKTVYTLRYNTLVAHALKA